MSSASDFVIERGILKRYLGADAYVEVPDKVKTVDSYAFQKNAAIRSVQLPESLREIGQLAFSGCDALEQLYIPANVEQLRGIIDRSAPQSFTIVGKSESAAHSYALSHQFTFVEK